MEKEDSKQKKGRSASYPSCNLREAVEAIDKIKKGLGNSPFNRDNGAKALGYGGVNGASASKIGALVHFGLLERVGGAYKVSTLAERIVLPKSDEDKQLAIVEAAKIPKLYSSLFDIYQNSSLPAMLSNILVHDHRIEPSVSKKAANDFTESMEYAGLLKNGVLVTSDDNVRKLTQGSKSDSKEDEYGDDKDGRADEDKSNYQAPTLPSGIIITFPNALKTGFVLGEFVTEINSLENRAQKILVSNVPKNKNTERKSSSS